AGGAAREGAALARSARGAVALAQRLAEGIAIGSRVVRHAGLTSGLRAATAGAGAAGDARRVVVERPGGGLGCLGEVYAEARAAVALAMPGLVDGDGHLAGPGQRIRDRIRAGPVSKEAVAEDRHRVPGHRRTRGWRHHHEGDDLRDRTGEARIEG